MPFLHDADGESAQNIDQRDQDGRDGVAANELARPVHRSIKIRFLFHLAAARAGLFFIDHPGIQFGINRHLFAGHRVQGEPGRDLRDTPGTLGDDNEIDQDENEEDDEADDVIAADDEIPECLDDMTGITVEQNQAGRRNIQGQSKQRDEQQQGGKAGEFRRFAHI